MDEAQFRDFFRKRPRMTDKLLEEFVAGTSPEHLLEAAKQKGGHLSGVQAIYLSELLRMQLATNIGLVETGVASPEEVIEKKIEILPEDFPADE